MNYRIVKDYDESSFPMEFVDSYRRIKPYTMVDHSGAFATWCAVNYVIARDIDGAFVECGVWQGGVSMLIAQRLRDLRVIDRIQYLYDTFEGMSEPTNKDIDKHGVPASEQLAMSGRADGDNDVWAYASIDMVKRNFRHIGLDSEEIHFVKGRVEETIPKTTPDSISVLRLDTDWYESTRHELEYLYPRLSLGGVLLIDDYSYWSGCREAVDEYFSQFAPRPLFTFLSNGSVAAVKF